MVKKALWKIDGDRFVEEKREDNDSKPQLLLPCALSSATATSGCDCWLPLPHPQCASACARHTKTGFVMMKDVCATWNLPSTAITCTLPGNPCSAVRGGTLLPLPAPTGDRQGPGLKLP